MTAEKWSSFAAELSRLAEDILQAIEHRVEDHQELVIGALYARAYQSFLASIQLAEAGLTDDASTLIRSMTESAIAMCATRRDQGFILRLIEDETYNLNAYANADKVYREEAAELLRDDEEDEKDETLDVPLRAEAEDDVPIQAKLKDNVPLQAKADEGEPSTNAPSTERLRRINWAEIASHEFLTRHLYNAHYRPMSSHVHVAIASLRTGTNFSHVDWRPNRAAAPETVARAFDVMIWATLTALGFMKLDALRPTFETLRDKGIHVLHELDELR